MPEPKSLTCISYNLPRTLKLICGATVELDCSLKRARAALGRVSRTRCLGMTVRNCTRDEGGPFEAGSQVQVSSHRELLSSRAMVVSVAETSGPDPGRQG